LVYSRGTVDVPPPAPNGRPGTEAARAPGDDTRPEPAPPASPEAPPALLVCDHRGSGLSATLGLLARRGFRVRVSPNLQRSLRHLAEDEPDVILLAPATRSGSIELEALARAAGDDPAWMPPAVLVVADPADPLPVLEAALRSARGGSDVIYRSAPPEEYVARVERLTEGQRRRRESDELRHRAYHDDRTDLLRPKIFESRIQEHFSAAQRHGLSLALVLIDLDRFGAVNKEHDHTVGDRIIARVGELIRHGLRSEDCGGRLGGDEFAVLLPYTEPKEAAHVVKRLQEGIASVAVHWESPRGETVRVSVTASLGFETFDGGDLATLEELRLHAEQALRDAKVAGGNRVHYYRGAQPAKPRRRAGGRRRTKTAPRDPPRGASPAPSEPPAQA